MSNPLSKTLIIPDDGAIQTFPEDNRVLVVIYNTRNKPIARFSLYPEDAEALADNVKRTANYIRTKEVNSLGK